MLKDIDLRFMVHPLTGDLLVKYENEAINQALKTIVLTGRNERPLDPMFGVGVYDLLFETFRFYGNRSFCQKNKTSYFYI